MPEQLPHRYLAALRRYLKPGASASLSAARGLGRRAVAVGLHTLDLVRMHERAMVSLLPAETEGPTREEIIEHSETFFAEALTPLEETHRGALEAEVDLEAMKRTLTQRTQELAASVNGIRNEKALRLSAERTLRLTERASSKLLSKSSHLQTDLRRLTHRLETSEKAERRRIGHKLHSEIVQTLICIKAQLTHFKAKEKAASKDLSQSIDHTQRLVKDSVATVHSIARDLRPTLLDDLGLVPALESYLRDFMRDIGIRVTFSAYSGIEEISRPMCTVLYRVTEEALSNVARYAQASRVDLNIFHRDGKLCAEIHDNGQGFDVGRSSRGSARDKLGLIGMRERVEMIGGTFCVQSAPGKETTLRIEIPTHHSRSRHTHAAPTAPTTLACP